VEVYCNELDEDSQVAFKGSAKAFSRAYGFLACVLPYTRVEWEERTILLDFLIAKLPSPREDDLSLGILETIDMDSYRIEKQAMLKIALPDAGSELEPMPAASGAMRPEPEIDRLSNILRTFNDLFGDIDWADADRVGQLITETIPSRVADDQAFRNARQNSDEQNARIEHDRALVKVVTSLVQDDTELFKQFMENEDFKRWMTNAVFNLAYDQAQTG